MALVFNIFTFNMLEVFAKTDKVNFSADSSDFVLLSDELVQKGYRLKIYDAYRPQGYIAEHSGHSIGSTVNSTLFDMNTEKDVDMGGTFDYFGETTKSVVSSANTTSSTASTTMLGNSPDWIAKL